MAGFPIGYPVLFGMAGAGLALVSDKSNETAALYGAVGIMAGLGLGLIKQSAEPEHKRLITPKFGLGSVYRNAGGVRVLR